MQNKLNLLTYSFFTLSALFVIVSCGGNSNNIEKNIPLKDTVVEKKAPVIKKDTFVSKQAELTENAKKIEQKYGEQWDFCACVIRVDSINDAVEKSPSNEQLDKLMERFDYVETKCKALTTFDQTIPAQRDAHERKVKKCLKAAGLKM